MPHGKAEPKRQEAPAPQEQKRRVDPDLLTREELNRQVAEQSARNHPGLTVEKALEMLEDLGF